MTNIISGVYIIRCRLTGQVYVGSSKDVKKRLNEHRSTLRRGCHRSRKLQTAWKKNGEDNFEFLLVEEVFENELQALEQKYINDFNSFELGFNGLRKAVRVSLDRFKSKLKQIKEKRGRGSNPKSRANLLKPHKGSVKTTLTLKPQTKEVAKVVGDGNMSRGFDSMSEVLSEAKLAIECLLGDHPAGKELGERVLVKLKELEIDQLYKEMESELPKPKPQAIII